MSTASPAERRAAWLSLTQGLERMLLATRENAKAMKKTAQAMREDIPEFAPQTSVEEWDATIWAAHKLLESIHALHAPEVPEDPALGQEAIPMPGETVQDYIQGLGFVDRSSTTVDNPGEDVELPDPDGSNQLPIPVYFFDDKGKAHQSREE